MTAERIVRPVTVDLVEPFRTARGTVERRSVVLVGLGDGGVVGWGEAPAFGPPWTEPYERTYEALARWADGGDTTPLDGTARVAVEAARIDLDARRRGVPLWSLLGGRPDPVPARVAVGGPPGGHEARADALEAFLARVGHLVARGIRAVKLKVRPGWDVVPVGAVRERWPELDVAVDANAAYDEDAPVRALDELAVSFIEQPFAPDDLARHARLRERIAAPVVLDESTRVHPLRSIVAAGAADRVALKSAVVGARRLLEIGADLADEGVGIHVGGLLESDVGRAHILAVAAHPTVVDVDLAPWWAHLAQSVATEPIEPVDGWFRPPEAPGIGVEPSQRPSARSSVS